MIFLVEYDRSAECLVELKAFSDAAQSEAERARLSRELQLNGDELVREVVLLEAQDEQALRRTHQRYFESLQSLAASTESASARDELSYSK